MDEEKQSFARFISPHFYIKKFPGLWQFFKFAVVGVVNTAVDWAVFFIGSHYIFTEKSAEPWIKAVAFLAAMLNSYLWNTIWTFRKDYKLAIGDANNKNTKKGVVFVKFAIVSIAGWIINVGTFQLVRFNGDQSQIISLIAASAASTLLNFFMNKFWTYKKSRAK